MKVVRLILLAGMALLAQGCVLTKLVTVPMRVGGAVVSIVPIAGDTAHVAIDKAAETVDRVPL